VSVPDPIVTVERIGDLVDYDLLDLVVGRR
jgi:hypothetical protein